MDSTEARKDEFRKYLSTKVESGSTVDQYLSKLTDLQNWFILHGIVSKTFNIWIDTNQISLIQHLLSNDFQEIWKESNRKKKHWLSAPWNHWLEFVRLSPISDKMPKEEVTLLNSFIESSRSAHVILDEDLVRRFIMSILSKNFVILTGLSGSGKTNLAVSFASWLDSGVGAKSSKFRLEVGAVIKSRKVEYRVLNVDSIAVTLLQEGTGIKVSIPFELIDEWIDCIHENKFSDKTTPRVIRNAVEKTTKYSTQLNSFETHLKATAFHLMNKANTFDGNQKQYCLVAVGADWTNRDPLLGYADALRPEKYVKPDNGVLDLIQAANADPERPYFLILDEMNLSHVERYFADFLSAMELHGEDRSITLHSSDAIVGIPKKLPLPENLFIIGTVNIDETTYMFSPKVLDRANVIEFRVTGTEMAHYLENAAPLDLTKLIGKGKEMGRDFMAISRKKTSLDSVLKDLITKELNQFFSCLQDAGAEFGYRSASEILRFACMVQSLDATKDAKWILDVAIMQKLLPKLHGSRRKLAGVLESIADLCWIDGAFKLDLIYKDLGEKKYFEPQVCRYPISLDKVCRMYRNLLANGFTSYAEA